MNTVNKIDRNKSYIIQVIGQDLSVMHQEVYPANEMMGAIIACKSKYDYRMIGIFEEDTKNAVGLIRAETAVKS